MIAPLLLLAAFLGVWELYVALSGINEIVLPPPHDVAAALVTDADLLWLNFRSTAVIVGGGVALALVLGFGLAFVLHLSGRARRAVFPFLVASQAMPIVVIAPLLVIWLGYDLAPKLVIVALVCFFPVVVTTLDALRRVEADKLKLMRTLGASRVQVLRWVEAPSALPAALSGAKIALAVAVIGSVLAEDAGSESGLGHMITQANSQYAIASSFAAVVVLGVFAISLYYALNAAERRLAPPTEGPTP
jgi:NitT/TauT family transport system permease protein/putative hydroxymethylpyrimidine transport system permease protein